MDIRLGEWRTSIVEHLPHWAAAAAASPAQPPSLRGAAGAATACGRAGPLTRPCPPTPLCGPFRSSRRPPGAAAQPQGAWLPLNVPAGEHRQGPGRPGALCGLQRCGGGSVVPALTGRAACKGAGACACGGCQHQEHTCVAQAGCAAQLTPRMRPACTPSFHPWQLAVMRYWNGNRVNVPRTTVMYLSGQRGVTDVVRAGRRCEGVARWLKQSGQGGRASCLPREPAWRCRYCRRRRTQPPRASTLPQGMAWEGVLCDWYQVSPAPLLRSPAMPAAVRGALCTLPGASTPTRSPPAAAAAAVAHGELGLRLHLQPEGRLQVERQPGEGTMGVVGEAPARMHAAGGWRPVPPSAAAPVPNRCPATAPVAAAGQQPRGAHLGPLQLCARWGQLLGCPCVRRTGAGWLAPGESQRLRALEMGGLPCGAHRLGPS